MSGVSTMIIKKCISSVLLLVTIIVACSCVPDSTVTKSTEDIESNDSSLTSLEDNESTAESIVVPDYDVNSVEIDVTFDEIVDECLGYTGFDDPRNSGEDHVINDDLTYYSDYSYFLDDVSSPDATGFVLYHPAESDRHIERFFSLHDTSLGVFEFDSEEWAEVAFSSNLTIVLEMEDFNSIDRHESEGYYFTLNDYCYEVEYLVGNCIIQYAFPFNDHGTDVRHTTYINICDELGLPISAEMAAEILG